MFKPSKLTLACACLAAGVLAGCDTGVDDAAQGDQAASAQTEEPSLDGLVERGFAGTEIPAVTLTDPAGITLDLASTKGKPVLLNLWATWCAPCVVEMPLLDTIAGEMGDELRVLTVSEDINGAEAVEPFFEEKGFKNLPRWFDANNDLAFEFGGGGSLPLTILYDAEGKEVWRVIGAFDWASNEARAMLGEASEGAKGDNG